MRKIIAISAILPAPLSAQSFQSARELSAPDSIVSIGLSVPLGSGGSRAERQPRLDFAIEHRRRDADDLEVRELGGLETRRPFRLGVTLSDKPQLMLNGRAKPQDSARYNLSTAAWIGIGVGTAAVGALVFYEALKNASE